MNCYDLFETDNWSLVYANTIEIRHIIKVIYKCYEIMMM